MRYNQHAQNNGSFMKTEQKRVTGKDHHKQEVI